MPSPDPIDPPTPSTATDDRASSADARRAALDQALREAERPTPRLATGLLGTLLFVGLGLLVVGTAEQNGTWLGAGIAIGIAASIALAVVARSPGESG